MAANSRSEENQQPRLPLAARSSAATAAPPLATRSSIQAYEASSPTRIAAPAVSRSTRLTIRRGTRSSSRSCRSRNSASP